MSCCGLGGIPNFFSFCLALLQFHSIIVAKTMHEVRCYTKRVRFRAGRNAVQQGLGFIDIGGGGGGGVGGESRNSGGPVVKGREGNGSVVAALGIGKGE